MAKEEVQDGTGINAAKLKALQATIDKIEKDYGKGTIMKLGDQPKWEVSVIPSGSIALDAALGIGGYPRGRVIEIYGPESSGKTTLAIHAIAQAQKQGGIAAIIDAEHAFDRTYAKNLGVDLDDSSTWVSAYAECGVKGNGTARNHRNFPFWLISQLHDRTFTVIFLNLVNRRLQCLEFRSIDTGTFLYFFLSHKCKN